MLKIKIIISLLIIFQSFQALSQKEKVEQIDKKIAEAVKKEDYDLAARLKKERRLRLEIDSALSVDNYEKASELKTEIEALYSNSSKQVNKSLTTKVEDYNYSTTIPSTGIIPPAPGKSVVYFVFMESKYLIREYELFDNDKYIGFLTGKKYIRYECEPGEKLFWISAENKEFLTADLSPNKIYFVKGKLNKASGFLLAHVAFRLVDYKDEKEVGKMLKNVENIESHSFTKDHIVEKNVSLKGFIENILNRYHQEWKNEYNFKNLSSDMYYKPR